MVISLINYKMVENKSEWTAGSFSHQEYQDSSLSSLNSTSTRDHIESSIDEIVASSVIIEDNNDVKSQQEKDEFSSSSSSSSSVEVDDDHCQKINNNNNNDNFEVGDHVYSWCSFLGIPFVYQHHGIVIDRNSCEGTVTILDFSCIIDCDESDDGNKSKPLAVCSISGPQSSFCNSSSNNPDIQSNKESILREYTIDENQARVLWHKVVYNSPWSKNLTKRSGTVSKAKSDKVDIVLARAEFLLHNHTLISSYDVTKSNCEHVAVWCKTGRFISLQLASYMRQSIALSTVPTIAASTATATTTAVVPAAGIWGWFGFTSTATVAVPLHVLMPWLIPVTILIPAVSAGKTMFDIKRWNHTTERLNENFDYQSGEGKCIVYRCTSSPTTTALTATMEEKKIIVM